MHIFQVNADVVNWLNLTDGKKIKISVRSASVGRCISTKALGSTERRDITHMYKYGEGNRFTPRLGNFSSLLYYHPIQSVRKTDCNISILIIKEELSSFFKNIYIFGGN